MNRRTKFLGIGALVIFGLYFADSTYRSRIEEPTTRLTDEVTQLTKQITDSNDAQALAQRTIRRLESYSERALPYDPQLARSGYQQWLLEMVSRHDVKSVSVDAGQPRTLEIRSRVQRRKRIQVGHTISYTLRGQATLAVWTDLLAEFRQAGHLHKIKSLSFNPLGSEGQLDANLTIEVLSLTSSPHKDSLSTWTLASKEGAEPPREKYSALVRRNLFARGFAKELYEVELKAITFDRKGEAEAWFRTDGSGSTHTVRSKDTLPVALHEIKVDDIQLDRALVQVNGEPIWVALGQTVGEAASPQVTEQ